MVMVLKCVKEGGINGGGKKEHTRGWGVPLQCF